MYLDHWGLHSPPFINAPNGNIFFQSPQHIEALHRLLYIVQQRKGVVMISGEVGCGKTTLVRALENFVPKNNFYFARIPNPALDPTDFIRAVLLKLGDTAEAASKTMLLNRLQRMLEGFAEQKIETILVIDEAHMITDNTTLDEIRMLLNIQSDSHALITMILLGQPPLLKKLEDLHPLNERISMRILIKPLDMINTGKYIFYRLKQAGARNGIFSKEAVMKIFHASGGIPLRINNISDRSLLIGLMHKTRQVTVQMVEEALLDMG